VVVTFVLAVFALVASVLAAFVVAVAAVVVIGHRRSRCRPRAAVEEIAASASDQRIV